MGYYEKLLKINEIRNAMADEISKRLFDARIDYMIDRDEERFYEVSDSLGKGWFCREVEDVFQEVGRKGIIIFGSGHDGIRTKRILENCNYFPAYFCDSDNFKVGMVVDNLEVIAADDLLQKYRDYIVILGSARYAEEMYQSLVGKGFSKKQIIYPQYGILVAEHGNQYFDIFPSTGKEIFVDAGGYNGDTALSFVKWTNGKYNKVYIFEPIAKMADFIKKRIKEEKIDRVEIYNNALWKCEETMSFSENGAGSHLSGTGKEIIKGISLDDVIKEGDVTFIKMDIEGCELMAIEGAKDNIRKNKPKLAICIYHKPEDILEIPLYLLELVPEYKFYIRHYTSCMWETVLYAEAL